MIDTSFLIQMERGTEDLETLRRRTRDEPVFISVVSASELLHGEHRANSEMRRARRERFVEWILDTVPLLSFDLSVARVHARIWADLKRRGTMIGAHDMMIAATALAHELRVLTFNKDEFRRVEGLELLA